MVKVKICGLTRSTDAKAAADLGADYLGMIFAPSPRQLDLKAAEILRASLPGFERWVAVFVNQSHSEITRIAKQLEISHVQLHGDENPEFCRSLQDQQLRVIKAFSVKSEADILAADSYKTPYVLLDSYSPGQRGGTGERFDWQLLKNLKTDSEVFISGGLRTEYVHRILRGYSPYALDVSSGVEDSPGIKNLEKMRDFIEAAKGQRNG